MRRYGYFEDQAKIDEIADRDPEFNSFKIATKGYLPIPTKELDLNEFVEQNAGW